MKWFLVVITVAAPTAWGEGHQEYSYPMPDKETCMESVKTARVDNHPEAKQAVIVTCVQK